MTTLSGVDFEKLRELEEGLWRSETRFDRERMSRALAPDFIEFGRSGRVYRLGEGPSVEPPEIPAQLPLPKLEIRLLHPDVALVTYDSDVAYPTGRERAHRSSVWTRTAEGWECRFHQGTPIPGQG